MLSPFSKKTTTIYEGLTVQKDKFNLQTEKIHYNVIVSCFSIFYIKTKINNNDIDIEKSNVKHCCKQTENHGKGTSILKKFFN